MKMVLEMLVIYARRIQTQNKSTKIMMELVMYVTTVFWLSIQNKLIWIEMVLEMLVIYARP